MVATILVLRSEVGLSEGDVVTTGRAPYGREIHSAEPALSGQNVGCTPRDVMADLGQLRPSYVSSEASRAEDFPMRPRGRFSYAMVDSTRPKYGRIRRVSAMTQYRFAVGPARFDDLSPIDM